MSHRTHKMTPQRCTSTSFMRSYRLTQNRSAPTGGRAYGMPRKLYTTSPVSVLCWRPRTGPYCVDTTKASFARPSVGVVIAPGLNGEMLRYNCCDCCNRSDRSGRTISTTVHRANVAIWPVACEW